MWWGISYWTLAGLGAVSVRLGGRWHLQRRPGNPTCFAPSCAAHSVLACALLTGVLSGCGGGVGGLFGGARGLGTWVGNQRRQTQPYLFSRPAPRALFFARFSRGVCVDVFGRLGLFCGGRGLMWRHEVPPAAKCESCA